MSLIVSKQQHRDPNLKQWRLSETRELTHTRLYKGDNWNSLCTVDGRFHERIRSWFQKRTKIKWGPYWRLTSLNIVM